MTPQRIAVLDVGGTTLRSALFRSADRTLGPVTRAATAGLGLSQQPPQPDRPQDKVIEQVVETARQQVLAGADAVVVAFAGPVTANGTVLAAPTIVGSGWRPINLAALASAQLGVAVTVINDLTAAAWRYHSVESRPFCLITVSSGIGNKVLWGDQVLIDSAGYGGEIGHWRVDPSPRALPCECGGRGHLGAIASGRGGIAVARDAARRDPEAFAASCLSASATPQSITTHDLVRAVHAGDEFAIEAVKVGVAALASAITAVFSAVGLRRFLLIGGFAQAMGPPYLMLVRQALADAGCFGLGRTEVAAMVDFGAADDDHSLIGAGLWALDHPTPTKAPALSTVPNLKTTRIATDDSSDRAAQ